MTAATDPLATFLLAARRAVAETSDEAALTRRLAPLLQTLAATPGWWQPAWGRQASSQRPTRHALHEEPNRSLALWAVRWPPGYTTPPHNHLTWAVIVGVGGTEVSTSWEHAADGGLRARGDQRLAAGDVLMLASDDIHSVTNHAAEPSLSLHLYGVNPETLPRQQFDRRGGRATLAAERLSGRPS